MADTQINMFKADMQVVQSQAAANGNQMVQATDPIAQRLLAQLEVLQNWAGMFRSLIERYESSNYSNFDTLVRSDDLSSVFI